MQVKVAPTKKNNKMEKIFKLKLCWLYWQYKGTEYSILHLKILGFCVGKGSLLRYPGKKHREEDILLFF